LVTDKEEHRLVLGMMFCTIKTMYAAHTKKLAIIHIQWCISQHKITVLMKMFSEVSVSDMNTFMFSHIHYHWQHKFRLYLIIRTKERIYHLFPPPLYTIHPFAGWFGYRGATCWSQQAIPQEGARATFHHHPAVQDKERGAE